MEFGCKILQDVEIMKGILKKNGEVNGKLMFDV